jgi:galactokinase
MSPPKLSHAKANLSATQNELIDKAKSLYQERLAYFAQTHHPPAYVCCSPGRVNLIGEHVDYQNGYVLPMCLDDHYQTICYGTGFLHTTTGTSGATTMAAQPPTTIRLRLVSDQADVPEMIEERRFSVTTITPPPPPSSSSSSTTMSTTTTNVNNTDNDNDEDHPTVDEFTGSMNDNTSSSAKWVNYVVGVIAQYLPDIPQTGCVLDLAMSYTSTIPISAGLSSSAALEVVTALFLECFLHDGMAYSSVSSTDRTTKSTAVLRALRCQQAEHTWAHSPCGIMDQYVVSCTSDTTPEVMLIDCRSLTSTPVVLKETDDTPVFLITNSMVPHDISNDAQYGLRRRECYDAVSALQSVPLYHVESLRDAVLADLEKGKHKLISTRDGDDTLYKRAHHVISENVRTTECAVALRLGLWDKAGALMNASHLSLQNDYNVSCKEVDVLVQLTQALDGVYGSRMTGGGFGGCTVTLVQPDQVKTVMDTIQSKYYEQTGLRCQCFVTRPGHGAKILAIDMDCKPESDFFKK